MNVNLANAVTLMRIVLTPFFLICLAYKNFLPAFVFFMASITTDLADGLIARLGKQKTRLGAFLDTLADKLLLVPTYILLASMDLIPKWLFILLICRDLSILVGWLIYSVNDQGYKMRSRLTGKLAIMVQMIFFMAILAASAFQETRISWILWLMGPGSYLVAFLTFVSFLDYTIFGSRHLVETTQAKNQ